MKKMTDHSNFRKLFRIFGFLTLFFAIFSLVLFVGCGGGVSGTIPSPGDYPELPSYNSHSWMKDSAEDIQLKKLNEIAIPGTHDSGTYAINSHSSIAKDRNDNPVLDWVEKNEKKYDHWYSKPIDYMFEWMHGKVTAVQAGWAKSQEKGFYEQLMSGVRYLDLRVEYVSSSDDYYFVHSMRGDNIDQLIDGIKNFYQQPDTDKEIIILDMNSLYQFDENAHTKLIEKLKAGLVDRDGDSLLITRGSDLTINKIWSKNKRIILFYENHTTVNNHNELWSEHDISSPWLHTTDGPILINKMKETMENSDIIDLQSKGGFYVLQAIRTPDPDTIKDGAESYLWQHYPEVHVVGWLWDKEQWNKEDPTNLEAYGKATNKMVVSKINSDPQFRDLIYSRLNIMIINVSASYPYSGGYLKLIVEANHSRTEKNHYRADLSSKSPESGSVDIITGETEELRVKFLNTGTVSWDPNSVYLGSSEPHDRNTNLYTDDGNWISKKRIKMQNTSPVKPDEFCEFVFNIKSNNEFTSSKQTFELVADEVYNGTPAQWFGSEGRVVFHVILHHYRAELTSYPTYLYLEGANRPVECKVEFKNTGYIDWTPEKFKLHVPPNNTFILTQEGPVISMEGDKNISSGDTAVFIFHIIQNGSGWVPRRYYGFQLYAEYMNFEAECISEGGIVLLSK